MVQISPNVSCSKVGRISTNFNAPSSSFGFGLRYGKTGNKKRATCFAKLLQNEFNSDVARYNTHIKPVLQQIRLLTGLHMDGKTRNIAIQLILQQCCKTKCTFFVCPCFGTFTTQGNSIKQYLRVVSFRCLFLDIFFFINPVCDFCFYRHDLTFGIHPSAHDSMLKSTIDNQVSLMYL